MITTETFGWWMVSFLMTYPIPCLAKDQGVTKPDDFGIVTAPDKQPTEKGRREAPAPPKKEERQAAQPQGRERAPPP